MLSWVKQNLFLLILLVLTLNVVALTAFHVFRNASGGPAPPKYEIIDCSDSAGRIHKCIRIDAKAGEINDVGKGATYRVIYGQ